jgi:hypothetical protein
LRKYLRLFNLQFEICNKKPLAQYALNRQHKDPRLLPLVFSHSKKAVAGSGGKTATAPGGQSSHRGELWGGFTAAL